MVAEVAKTRVGVMFGGRSGEHEVSLMSARSVLAAIDADKYAITQIGIRHDGSWISAEGLIDFMVSGSAPTGQFAAILPDPTHPGLLRISIRDDGARLELLSGLDVVFPVLHGTFGEDGTLQGLLELADMAYVGAGVLASSVGMDKVLFKDVMRAHDIPVLNSLLVLRGELESAMGLVLDKAEALAPYPLFVKPANLGSSVGVSKVNSRSDLIEGLMEAARFDRRILVERGVNGREIEISVLGNELPEASLPGEVIPSADFYSYQAKYHDDRSRLIIPAQLSDQMLAQVQELALRAYRAIDCAGMARVDFLIDKDSGELFLNEVNTIPGFTSISMYPKLWEASGLPYPALVDKLLELALERKADRDRIERRYA
jgi:D-alanine-D-alanine ligase